MTKSINESNRETISFKSPPQRSESNDTQSSISTAAVRNTNEQNRPSVQDIINGLKPYEFKTYCLEYQYKLYAEYLKIVRRPLTDTTKTCMLPDNTIKNRYNDVLCYDHSRVVLNDAIEGDYIHANYVDSYKHPRGFIGTQAPLEDSVADFWRMVYQEKCLVVVMLTRFIEGGKTKCNPYWPQQEGKSIRYGPCVVQNCGIKQATSSYELTEIKIKHRKHKNTPHFAYHVLYLVWPDKGLPKHISIFIEFIKFIRNVQKEKVEQIKSKSEWHGVTKRRPPIVVHCSAGVGRTGTFIALDTILRRFEKVGRIEICETVRKMRQQRKGLVQTADQYVFLYVSIISHLVSNNIFNITQSQLKQISAPDGFTISDVIKVLKEQKSE